VLKIAAVQPVSKIFWETKNLFFLRGVVLERLNLLMKCYLGVRIDTGTVKVVVGLQRATVQGLYCIIKTV
jgi:hypothetical protein